MSFGPGGFIVAIVALMMLTIIATTWMRMKHGFAPSDAGGPGTNGRDLSAERQIELLSTENAGLKGQVSRLEERLAVLERIVTDPAERTARDIDSLR